MSTLHPTAPFYNRFKELCDEKGVSMTKALQEMRLSSSYITLWKRRGPGDGSILALSNYFHKGTEELFPEGRIMSFTAEELRIIRLYRDLNASDRIIVLGKLLELHRFTQGSSLCKDTTKN